MLTRRIAELYRRGTDWEREIEAAIAERGLLDALLGNPQVVGRHKPPRRAPLPFPSPMMMGGASIETTRRYLRLRMTNNHFNSPGVFSLTQLSLYETIGGPDVLAGSGATITATSTGGNPSSNLTDGNATTYFWTNGAGTQDIWIDWGAGNGKLIVAAGLRPRNDGGSNYGQFPLAGSLDYSADGASYTNDWSFTKLPVGWTGAAFPLIVTRNPTLIPNTGSNRRIWGIRANNASSTPHEFGKLELRATIGGATMCTGGVALAATPFNSGFSPDVAFSGAGNQFAFGSSLTPGGLIFYDFLEGNEKAKPAQIMLQASGIPSRCMTDFDLVYCTGLGEAPVLQQNFTTPATWTGSEIRTFTVT